MSGSDRSYKEKRSSVICFFRSEKACLKREVKANEISSHEKI